MNTPTQRAVKRRKGDGHLAAENGAVAELKALLAERDRELSEARAIQSATAEVLNVISRSTTDLDAVLDMIVRTAAQLCQASWALIFRLEDDGTYRLAAASGVQSPARRFFEENPPMPGRSSVTGRSILEGRTVHVPDILADAEHDWPAAQDAARQRTVMAVPLIRRGTFLGVITLARDVVRPFTEAQIKTVTAFANQAVIAIDNARLFNEVQARTQELTKALERQTATGEILAVISRSPNELQPVLDTIVRTAARLCAAEYSMIFRCDYEKCRLVAANDTETEHLKYMQTHPVTIDSGSAVGRVALNRATVHLPDVLADPGFTRTDWQEVGKQRTVLGVPLILKAELLGVLILARTEVNPFTDKQVELVSTFADQAVIAIENVRLFEAEQLRSVELSEALARQTATSEVLGVISKSLTDTQPVFDAIVQSGGRLFPNAAISIALPDGDVVKVAALAESDSGRAESWRQRFPFPLAREYMHGAAILDRRIVDVPDAEHPPEEIVIGARDFLKTGYRAVTIMPMMRGDEAIGALSIVRLTPGPISDKQVALLKTFADQAVIAIENVRLFEEVQARTRALTEALEQQKATTEILRVISHSPTDLQPVFDTIAKHAVMVCGAEVSTVTRFDGELVHLGAVYGSNEAGRDALRAIFPMRPGNAGGATRSILEHKTIQIPDIVSDPQYSFQEAALAAGFRSLLSVPMIKGSRAIGAITVGRAETGTSSDAEVNLLRTFADQAVIAIENARLFDEVQARTEELAESLRQQTATADVLKVISRSALDLSTVLNTLVEAAARLCEADQGTIAREQDGEFRRVVSYGFSKAFDAAVTKLPVEYERGSATGRALVEGRVVHIPDVEADPEYTFAEAKQLGGFRTILAVPMLREGTAIGVVALTRIEARPFTDKQIELVSTFADQAAIAIENVRLFESVQSRSRELAASLEELRAAQDRLIQTEKLASLGQLTAGIAHEIKNPLNFINNFASVSSELAGELVALVEGLAASDAARGEIDELVQTLKENLGRIVQHGQRADSIVKNMLLHARHGSNEHRVVDVNGLVQESLNLAYHGARAEGRSFDVELERSLDPAAGEADLYPQEITRVLLNLMTNGFYAMRKRKAEGGDSDYKPILRTATRNLGDQIEISIRDNGTGIPPDVKERLFTPFFTTKPAGEGTGLGLSISHDIVVKQHGGSIAVTSEPSNFTEFRIVLPRAGGPAAVAERR